MCEKTTDEDGARNLRMYTSRGRTFVLYCRNFFCRLSSLLLVDALKLFVCLFEFTKQTSLCLRSARADDMLHSSHQETFTSRTEHHNHLTSHRIGTSADFLHSHLFFTCRNHHFIKRRRDGNGPSATREKRWRR